MKSVNIGRTGLLTKLIENREIHINEYNEALNGYRKDAVSKIKQMLKDAKDGKPFDKSIGLLEPISKQDDYDRAIAMLGMSLDEVIELSSSEFDCYVLDNWDWKRNISLVNSTYLGK